MTAKLCCMGMLITTGDFWSSDLKARDSVHMWCGLAFAEQTSAI